MHNEPHHCLLNFCRVSEDMLNRRNTSKSQPSERFRAALNFANCWSRLSWWLVTSAILWIHICREERSWSIERHLWHTWDAIAAKGLSVGVACRTISKSSYPKSGGWGWHPAVIIRTISSLGSSSMQPSRYSNRGRSLRVSRPWLRNLLNLRFVYDCNTVTHSHTGT